MMKAKSGFTLVEILIVVVILGILAAIVIPQFTNASTEAKAMGIMTQPPFHNRVNRSKCSSVMGIVASASWARAARVTAPWKRTMMDGRSGNIFHLCSMRMRSLYVFLHLNGQIDFLDIEISIMNQKEALSLHLK